MWDILRLNTEKCDSIEIDGLRYVVDQSNREPSMDDLERPFILHPDLARLAGEAALSVRAKRLIPKENLMEARKIMQLVYELYKTEVMVFILYNSVENEFITMLPKQKVSGGSCTVQAEDSIEGQGKDIIMVADFHSHPFGGHEFLSPIDHDNSTSYASVPIASFNFQTQPRVGGLYAFGKLKAIFGTIPLPQNQFCEEVDEFFTISEADREKWLPLIQAKIDAGRSPIIKQQVIRAKDNTATIASNKTKKKTCGKVDIRELLSDLQFYVENSDTGNTFNLELGYVPDGESVLENCEEFITHHFLEKDEVYIPIKEWESQARVEALRELLNAYLFDDDALNAEAYPELTRQIDLVERIMMSYTAKTGEDYSEASCAPTLFIVALYLFGVCNKGKVTSETVMAMHELQQIFSDDSGSSDLQTRERQDVMAEEKEKK